MSNPRTCNWHTFYFALDLDHHSNRMYRECNFKTQLDMNENCHELNCLPKALFVKPSINAASIYNETSRHLATLKKKSPRESEESRARSYCPPLSRQHCWVHVRRDVSEVLAATCESCVDLSIPLHNTEHAKPGFLLLLLLLLFLLLLLLYLDVCVCGYNGILSTSCV